MKIADFIIHTVFNMKKLHLILAGLSALILAGCLVPEHFTAAVDIHSDGSYAYRYNGTAIHVFAAMQLKQTGKLSAKDEAGLKAEADKAAKQPDVKKIAYTGNGHYDLQIEGQKKAGQPLKLMDFFSVTTDKDGVMTIASPEIKAKDKQELERLGVKIDGTLEVKLPKNAEIISQNATSVPTFFGMFSTYSWKIGKIDQQLMMKIRLKQ